MKAHDCVSKKALYIILRIKGVELLCTKRNVSG